MNNLMARIKGFDYKAFFLAHGEKIGMGVACLVVLIVLSLTTWQAYSGTPTELSQQASDTETRLRNNAFPQDKADELVVGKAERQVARVTQPLSYSEFDLRTEFSPKLIATRQPAEDVDVLVPTQLIAVSGIFAMEVAAPETAEPVRPAPAPAARGGRKDAAPAVDSLAPTAAATNMAMDSAAVQTRARRFNLVTGPIDRRDQVNRIKQKLHLDTTDEAADLLQYVNFKIERQRAVRGSNPWPDDESSWQPLNIKNSFLLLKEAFDFDPEIVAAEHTNAVLTAPLPHRLDGAWKFAVAGHPALAELQSEDQRSEQALNIAAAAVAGDTVEEQPEEEEGGYAGLQVNALRLRQNAAGRQAAGAMLDLMERMMPEMGMSAVQRGAFKPNPKLMRELREVQKREQAEAMAYAKAMQNPQDQFAPEQPRARRKLAGRAGGPGAAFAKEGDTLLFRYFDFDVEPGECYRYRVKLVILNPNFEQEFVVAPEVALGKTRESANWSVPSTPAAVQRDVEYALARSNRGKVVLDVVQNDPDVATLVKAPLEVGPGEYVGGTRTAQRLKPGTLSFQEEPVNFSSRDMLVDNAGLASIASAVQEDLKLTPAEVRDLQNAGVLDQALAITRFGEIIALDGDSKADLKAANQRYQEQKKEVEDLKKKTDDPSTPGGMVKDLLQKSGTGARGANPLKSSNVRRQLRDQMKANRGGGYAPPIPN